MVRGEIGRAEMLLGNPAVVLRGRMCREACWRRRRARNMREEGQEEKGREEARRQESLNSRRPEGLDWAGGVAEENEVRSGAGSDDVWRLTKRLGHSYEVLIDDGTR